MNKVYKHDKRFGPRLPSSPLPPNMTRNELHARYLAAHPRAGKRKQ